MNLIIRNFWHILRKFRTTSIMVILGLAAAFTVFLTVMIQCRWDFGYNGNFKNRDDTYVLGQYLHGLSWNIYTKVHPNGIQEIQQKYPALVDYFGFAVRRNYITCSLTKEDGHVIEFSDNCIFGVTEKFLSFVKLKIIAGNSKKILNGYDKAIVTKSYAKNKWGDISPVGMTVTLSERLGKDNTRIRSVLIEAVCEDFPDNCFLQNGIYYNADPNDPLCTVYIKMTSGTWADSIAERLETHARQYDQYMNISDGIRLFPLNTAHFSEIGTVNLNATLSLLFIGIAALIIAWINFVNFSIAMAPSRVKSINIQKIFGAKTGLLKFIVASESAVFSLIAFLLAIFCMNIINKNYAGDFFSANMNIGENLQILAFTGISIVVFGFVLGLYPAYYVTSVSPTATLSGSLSRSKRNVGMKNILTIVQFTTAVILIIIVTIIRQQYNYAVNYSYGMKRENVIYLNTDKLHQNDRQVFIDEIKTNPQILDCTSAGSLPGTKGFTMRTREFEGKEISYSGWFVDENFLNFFDVPIIKGDTFTKWWQIIINEEFAKQTGTVDVLGQKFDDYEIVGIAKNVNFEDLHHPVSPMGFLRDYYNSNFPWIFCKVLGTDTKQAIAHIKSVWEKFSSESLEINFLDVHFNNLYKRENDMANLLTIVSIITIIIAIMGVYGLITFNIRQKEKEIALRKIAGATLKDILLLLNRGVLIQLVIAFVVAAPAAYYIANRWLETFAYKISIQWWVFVLCWLLMVAITVATICMQTYRAATKNPIEALKTE